MSPWLPVALCTLPLLVGGCCCCNPFSLIPESLVESAVQEGFKTGLEAATGTRVDVDEGNVSIRTKDGHATFRGGDAGLDPRIPIQPMAGCDVSGGGVIETAEAVLGGFGHERCSVPFDDLRAHFEAQIKGIGFEPSITEIKQDDVRMVTIDGTAKTGAVRVARVVITQEKNGRGTSVLITVHLAK
jgi:hypothetical protein